MSLLDEIRQKKGAFIIAEIGVNYYDIARQRNIPVIDAARLMISEAAAAGAHAVKFQSYKAETLASRNSPAYWDQKEEPTKSQFELFSKFDGFGQEEYAQLAEHCKAKGTIFASTPFDFESAEYLDQMMPFYKISSSDLTNLPFIEFIANKGKPILLSTGAATIGETEQAVETIRDAGNDQICLLHCVLDYPTDYADANLNMIKHLQQIFPQYLVGLSDHTRPDQTMITVTAAYLYGAKVLEKHFTLDKSLPGNDHYHAMDPDDLRKLCYNLKMLETTAGQYHKRPLECERESRKQARRSIVAQVEIQAGRKITQEMLTYKRPGTGISPAMLEQVIGRTARRTIDADQLIDWDDI